MKKKIIFVIESLASGGAEKSLVTLLNLIDYSKYEVDLQLFSYGGDFQEMLPESVNLLPQLEYFSVVNNNLFKNFYINPKICIKRMKYSVMIRTKKLDNPQKAVLFWKATHACFHISEKEYDVAIAYAQGTPTFYVADCIKAPKKIAWVNVSFTPEGKWRKYISDYYQRFDIINCVSISAKKIFEERFPEHRKKTVMIYDINDYGMILKLSKLTSDVEKDMNFSGLKLLTVGRLSGQKGYDLALDAAKILKNKGISFRWYALGRGPLEQEMRVRIQEYDLDKEFVLLGVRSNPYPYFAKADIYVQTSKFEGFGLAIAEARMLNIPVVTTKFDAVYDQMINEKNGLVVEMNAEAVADGIQRLINDPTLYQQIKEYQMNEKKGNIEEINKLYELFK